MTNSDEMLSKNILKTVVYFDLFDYPLTAEQLFAFLPQNSVSVDVVKRTAEILVSKSELVKEREFFFLPTRKKDIVDRRTDEERYARRMLTIARLFSSFIKRFPFVRAIFLTGSLSKNVVDRSGDIDFMIVTAPNRVWICRTLLTAFRKIFLFGSKKYFCTNYYVTANGFSHQRRNLYAAIEVVTTKAVWNESAFDEFQSSNVWTKEFLPNSCIEPDKRLLISPSRSFFQRVCEFVLDLFPLDALDARLMEMHRAHWRNQFSSVDADQFNSMFIISPDVSAGWPEDRQGPVLEQFRRKVSSLGIG
ncbi:MAG: hypothetical protein HYV29_15945 [Ignavibacteriales bacterium]|nr:hypothetical protein [Ignavibacteriales bacterium]